MACGLTQVAPALPQQGFPSALPTNVSRPATSKVFLPPTQPSVQCTAAAPRTAIITVIGSHELRPLPRMLSFCLGWPQFCQTGRPKSHTRNGLLV